MLIRAFITHKEAENFTDCQDRFSINSDTKSIALSDGMSQSIFQKYWAEILVNAYTSKLDWHPDLNSVRSLSHLWREKVYQYVDKQKEEGKNPWRVERNLSDGLSAGATFLGIRFDGIKWKCQVLGDSCLVNIHDNHIKGIISSQGALSFNNYPDYYDSNPQKEGKGQLKTDRGELGEKDVILLVTDPFSDFLLRNKGTSEESNLIQQLVNIKTHEEYENVVAEWRDMGMHNDDSTLIIILPDGSDEFDVNSDDISQMIEEEKSELETHLTEKTEPVINNDFDSQEINTERNPCENNDPKESVTEGLTKQPISIAISQLLNDEFHNKLESCILSNLHIGLILSNRQKQEQAKKITSEIILLINNIIIKE